MKGTLIFLLSILTISANAQTPKYSLQQCMDYALANQPTLAKAKLDKEIQFEVNKEVVAIARPQVSATGSMQYMFIIPKQRSDANAFNFGDAFSFFQIDTPAYIAYQQKPKQEYSEIQFGLPLSLSANLQVSQILFDPQVFVALKARESLNELAELNIKRTEEEIRVNVSKAYYNCIIAEKRKGLLDENIALVTKIENTTQKLFEAGFAEKIDVLRLTVQRNNLMTEKTKVDNLIRISYYLLKFQMGMPLDNAIALNDDLDAESLKKDLMLESDVAYDKRTEMQLLQMAKKLNGIDYERYQKSYLPTLAAIGQFGYATQTKRIKEFATLPYFPSGVLGLSLNVPLYGGGARNAKMAQVQLNIQKNEEDIRSFQMAVDLEVSNARVSLRNNLLTLANQEENIKLAEKVYDISQKKYKEGLGTNIEIIQAQTALKEAQTNYISTLFETMISKIDLQKALGIYK